MPRREYGVRPFHCGRLEWSQFGIHHWFDGASNEVGVRLIFWRTSGLVSPSVAPLCIFDIDLYYCRCHLELPWSNWRHWNFCFSEVYCRFSWRWFCCCCSCFCFCIYFIAVLKNCNLCWFLLSLCLFSLPSTASAASCPLSDVSSRTIGSVLSCLQKVK